MIKRLAKYHSIRPIVYLVKIVLRRFTTPLELIDNMTA